MATVPSAGETVGRYRIVERLGHGAMGVVFRAFDEQLQRYVALKFMSGESDEGRRKRFHNEALALARLNHPFIGVIHGFEKINGNDVLVMECVEGKTLDEHLGSSRLPEADVISTGLQLASALRVAHAAGVIHRDLKPSNIMITRDGDAKVLDFGLALLSTATSPTLTTLKVEGTVQYMAPEILCGSIPDERSDIYSLGAVLYEMATGRPPHAQESLGQLVQSALYTPATSPHLVVPGISEPLAAIILKAIAIEPKQRYATAEELRADLKRLQSGTVEGLPQAVRRRRWWPIAAVLVVALAAVLLWVGSGIRPAEGTANKRVIAVLPFDPIGGAAENRALSRGLTDLITIRLAQVSRRYGFEVVPASEIRTQEIASSEQARKKLGANLVVEGSWDFGAQPRIMYALVDSTANRSLNASVVNANPADIYAAENDVYQQLLAMLHVELTADVNRDADKRRREPTSYEYYVKGRGYLSEYQKPDNLTRGIALLKSATESDPGFGAAFAALAEGYWRQYEETKDPHWVADAMDACARASALDAGLPEVHTVLGLIHQGTGKPGEAAKEFGEALRIDPTNDTASRGLAASYEALGDFAKAVQTHQQAIAVRPDYWGGYSAYAVFLYKRGQLDRAAEQFERVIALVPDSGRGYSDLGGIRFLQGRYNEARRLYLKAIEIQPNYRAYSNLGTLEFFERRYNEAAGYFESALKMNDRDGRVWRNLGASYYWAGDRAKANGAYGRAADLLEKQLAVNPKDSAINMSLADSYAMMGDKAKASAKLKAALALPSDDADLAFRAAGVYVHIGERTLALDWLGKAVKRGLSVEEIQRDPTFDELRKDSRYGRAVSKNSSPEEQK